MERRPGSARIMVALEAFNYINTIQIKYSSDGNSTIEADSDWRKDAVSKGYKRDPYNPYMCLMIAATTLMWANQLAFSIWINPLLAAQSAFGLDAGEVAAFDALKRSFPALLEHRGWNSPSINGCKYDGVICDSEDHVVSLYEFDLNCFSSPEMKLNAPQNVICPEEVGNFRWMVSLDFSGVNGPLPQSIFEWKHLTTLMWSHCVVSLLPLGICRWTGLKVLELQNASLSGEIPACVFQFPNLTRVHLGNNKFTGSIPAQIGNAKSLSQLFLDNNEFEGCVPVLSNLTDLNGLGLDGNRLSCFSAEDPFCLPTLTSMSIRYNRLTSFPPHLCLPSLQVLRLSHNDISGECPGTIVHVKRLYILDVSYNRLSGAIPPLNSLKDLTHLLLSNNLLNSFEHDIYNVELETLDLSNNFLTGTVPYVNTTKMKILNIRNNQFHGKLMLPSSRPTTQWELLDISYNRLNFTVADLPSTPQVTNASHNMLFGNLWLSPGLSPVLDFSYNNLSGPVDWSSVSYAFHTYLKFLSVVGNPDLTPSPVPIVLETLALATAYPNYSCKVLSFSGFRESFFYDESLFEYQTCTCAAGSFGIVKDRCQKCSFVMPGSVECLGATTFSIAANFYPYKGDDGKLNTELCVSNPDLVPQEVNPCPSASLQASDVFNGNPGLCRNGATGRRCSGCICSANEGEDCYFKRSHYCAKCSASSSKLKRSHAIILLSTLVVLATVSATVVIVIIVKRRVATGDEGQFEGLPIGFFGTIRFSIAHGIAKVLISFVQFASELTSWSGALNAYLLRLSNFDVSGFGLQCIFREFTQPMAIFLLKVLVAFGLLALLWICIGFAAAVLTTFRKKLLLPHRPISDTLERQHLIQHNDEEDGSMHTRMNQFTRLGVSWSISLINLFYFGVSITIISAFFSDRQLDTRNVFMGVHPYIPWHDERARNVRVVAGLFFFFVPLVPIGTFVLLILFRKRLEDKKVKSYIGALFQSYRPSVFWWELVVLLRKFLVAAFSSIATHISLRSWLLVACFGTFLIAQLLVRPWKRRIENFADEIASVVLMVALVANMKTPLGDDDGGALVIVGRVFLLVFVIGAIAVWLWSVVTETKQFRRIMLQDYDIIGESGGDQAEGRVLNGDDDDVTTNVLATEMSAAATGNAVDGTTMTNVDSGSES